MHEKEVPRMCKKRGFPNKETPLPPPSPKVIFWGYFDAFYFISLINI
jgi:hypothetical protein